MVRCTTSKWFVWFISLVVIGLLLPANFAGAAPAESGGSAITPAQESAEQQLAERFAPIAMLKRQAKNCDRDGEGYFPAPLEVVLGNPEIALMRHGEDGDPDTLVMMGPTAQDLAGLDDSHYLDFPGNPRHPGCRYETDFKRYAAQMNIAPTAYARVVIDEDSGTLVLQYWFWYYFNDWNNTHESDWEMVQLAFDASSAAEALTQLPTQVGYAQHGGGELTDWDDTKLIREGDRIVVFPAAGSHGTYYGPETWIGWGENGTGFGCDTTTSPSNSVPLNVVLIPDEIDPEGPFAWLLFDGRWGQREAWEFNGPVGPNKGGKWKTPVEAMEDWRDSSLKVPGGRNTIGPSSTDLFCTLSAGGSRVLMELGTRPYLLLALVVGLLLSVLALVILKRQEVGEAFGLYRRHLRLFVLIGLTTIPIGILFNGFQFLLRDNPPIDWVIKWFNDTAGARMVSVAIAGGFQQAAMVLVVTPPIVQAVADIRAGRTPTVRESFVRGYSHFRPILVAMLIATAVAGALVILLIGIPIAIWLAIRWQFYGQAAVLDKTGSGIASLDQSRRSVRGRWWHALTDSLVYQLIAVIPGPFVGAILMLMNKTSVGFANSFSAVVYAITVPISVIGLTLAYLRYRDRRQESPAAETAAAPGD